MSYKIYARKGRKTIPISVESKHYYDNLSYTYLNLITSNAATATSEDNVHGFGPNKDTIKIINNTNNLHVVQGTGESDRNGNKVNLKGINMVLTIHFLKDVIATYLSHSESVMMNFNFRIMTVKFDQQMTTTDIARWFRETYIYTRNISITQGGNYPQQSNWVDKMRESTPWTGSFKILKDKKFTLDKEHTVAQLTYDLGFNTNVNFDNTSNNPTANQYINNIYTFIIGPSNNFLDMDAVSQSKVESFATPVTATFILEGNIKYVYYDV